MADPVDVIRIEDEKGAYEALAQALNNRLPENCTVEFSGWPVFSLKLEGADFHGTIPTRVMPPILELQKELNRIYCQAKYNTTNTNKLTAEEREMLELVVKVNEGCSEYVSALFDKINDIIKATDMSGRQVVVLFVGLGALLTADSMWENWVASKEREHALETNLEITKEHTRQMQLVAEAAKQEPLVKATSQSMDVVRSKLANSLQDGDNLRVGNTPIITGQRAKQIVPKPKVEPNEVRLDGIYTMLEVKFPKEYGDSYRFLVQPETEGERFYVNAAPSKLDDAQVRILADGGFGSKPVYMQINARRLRGEITRAEAVKISWPEDKAKK